MTKNFKIEELGKADLHIHSNHSDGKPSIEEILKYVEEKTDLDIIAICDHNTIEGAKEAQRLAKERNYRFQVIVGEEISTACGHIIGLFLQKPIEPNLSVIETLRLIKAQGGISSAPHPFFHTRMRSRDGIVMDGIGFIALMRDKKLLDAMEVTNGTPTLTDENIKAQLINDSLLFKAEVGGSDAHILDAIGKGYTLFEGKNPLDLKYALEYGQTRAMNRKWRLISLLRYAFFFIPRGFRVSIFTLLHGKSPRRPQIVNLRTPKDLT